ncbi:uncharacterized protein, partial [Temnothorax nylanderi]|uniref:uncharacterized protein n=1 Tax=Temnothorax nylanderi TaxID=102681 RepID=UPI003A8A7790
YATFALDHHRNPQPTVNLSIGKERKSSKFPDHLLIRKIIDQYDLDPTPEIIYTDGSYNETGRSTGASMVICDQDFAYKMSLPYLCSSYTAEAFAIKSALQLIKCQITSRNRDIIVLSDCKSVLESIYNNHINVHKNRYVTEARLSIFELERFCDRNVILVWIPAHVGIVGNELADGLAKEAASEEADPSIGIPVGDLMMRVRIPDSGIQEGDVGRHAIVDHSGVDAQGLRANHYNLGSSLRRKGFVEDERCECGCEREDIHHVLLRCRRFDDLRITMDIELRAEGFLEEIDIYRLIQQRN